MDFNCKYFKECGGCKSETDNYDEHLNLKIESFKTLWKNNLNKDLNLSSLRKLSTLRYRNRVDLTIANGRCGFYSKDGTNIIDIDDCPLFSEDLSSFFKKFRSHLPNINKGSVRLRVSPDKKNGVWIDFSNIDISFLLKNKKYLTFLNKISDVIEIGQKRKLLNIENFKIEKGKNLPWFESYLSNKSKIPLKMRVGGFSQTGFLANYILIDELQKLASSIPKDLSWLEVCSGSGNLTVAISDFAKTIHATEMDEDSLEGFKETLEAFPKLKNKIMLSPINIHKNENKIQSLLNSVNVLMVDPPRSGLGGFIKYIEDAGCLLSYIVYVSCYNESLVTDLKKIENSGFKVECVSGVDQFPFSIHMEWIVILKKTLI